MTLTLTPEQEKEALARKQKTFSDGLEKLEQETGMKLIAVLVPKPSSLEASLMIVPKTQ